MKECSKCNETKQLTEFHKDKECRQGVKNVCKACKTSQKNKWYKDNAERQSEKARLYRTTNKEATKQAREKWDSNNVGMVRAKEARRRASKIERTVAWADKEAITDIYKRAHLIKKELALDVHVDHVVPLRGELVSGLHVESNLQIIPAKDNLSKGNRYGA